MVYTGLHQATKATNAEQCQQACCDEGQGCGVWQWAAQLPAAPVGTCWIGPAGLPNQPQDGWVSRGAEDPLPEPFPFEQMTRLTAMAVYLRQNASGFWIAMDESEHSEANFRTILPCARQKNPSIEILITLGKDVPMWRTASANMDVVGPLLANFLDEHGWDGYNFDWEDDVDTEFYIGFLKQIRAALDANVTKHRRHLITVAPGWSRYPWDKRANGVVDTFDCMSYENTFCEADLVGRVETFELRWKIPRSTLLGGIECEPHWNGDPGWNPDSCIISKTEYAVKNGLQGMFSFRLENDHGPAQTFPARPTYHGHKLMYDTAKAAGAPDNFVLNTYMSLYDFHTSEQIGCVDSRTVV